MDVDSVPARTLRQAEAQSVHQFVDLSADAPLAGAKATYKSWRKKYRKMRLIFDRKMHACEDLYRQEQRALGLLKRLAIGNDRILDLLLDQNTCPQIPLDKRIDLSVGPPAEDGFALAIDHQPPTPRPSTSYQHLMETVPHQSRADHAGLVSFADFIDLHPLDSDSRNPPAFLSAEDIDDYLYEIDFRLKPDHMLPSLSPAAVAAKAAAAAAATVAATVAATTTAATAATDATAAATAASTPVPAANGMVVFHPVLPAPQVVPAGGRNNVDSQNAQDAEIQLAHDFALKNAISVHNWLRKHAPKIFSQDAVDSGGGAEAATDGGATDGRTGKPRAGKAGLEKAAKPPAAAKAKKSAVASRVDGALDAPVGDDSDVAGTAPRGSAAKRKRDDDSGYRPRASHAAASRPAKKRRKSEVAVDTAPATAPSRRTKKEAAAAAVAAPVAVVSPADN